VPASAFAFALAAAFVHALWNVLLARARDVQAATAVALVAAAVVFAPIAAATWDVRAAVWPFVVASAALETVYFALLAAAYHRAPLSVVYPVARGGAPVLVLVLGVAALHQRTSWRQAAGVALVVAGVLLVRGLDRADARGFGFGATIAACIAGYTLVDKHGIRHAAPVPYLELTMLGPSVVYAAAVVRVRGASAVRAAATGSPVAAGLATFAAYTLVLAALARASAASVAAVRETSVVIAALLAAAVLRERVGASRLAGAAAVAGGIALLAG
jgi:drug/metabolite transporter (DMT)-like permease